MCKRLQKGMFCKSFSKSAGERSVERGSRPISPAYNKKETHLRISYVPQQNLLYQMRAKSHISKYVSGDQNPCDM